LLLGHGDYDDSEDKNPYVGADFDAGEYFDNLTQKVYVWKAAFFIIHGLFKEGMLAFDKASQINPKNKHVYVRKIKALDYYIKHKEPKKYKTLGKYTIHPELSKELIKTCDKLLSVDKKNIGAYFQKEHHLSILKRYEEAIECCDMQIKLIQECDDVVSLFTGKKVEFLDTDGKPMEVQAWKQHQILYALKDKAWNFLFMDRHMEAKKCLLEILELDPYDENMLQLLHEAETKIAECYPLDKGNLENKKETSAFCDNCGKLLKPTAKFCGGCGTPRA
tara:strand:- start:25 stop:855 length:831 start_codon:yes stop_codon:yes gene_type:complete